jgi:hypothetical protein
MTPQMFQGNFSQTRVVKDRSTGICRSGNIIPTSRLSAVSLKLQQYLPRASSSNYQQSPYTAANNNDTDQTIDRIGQNFSQNVRLFFRYQRQTESIMAGASVPVNGNTSPVPTNNYTAATPTPSRRTWSTICASAANILIRPR